ncbi:hypothetical protein [Polyangium sp. 15x6]|uniref:hypothetical protein n=1 Tax=Polyangium sp. 15x6 TaxID=3042687 RepID=UPI00249BF9DA|nr:hypothetical protein [Polyangium sp. 15x6]MDI3282693.1 hypothetical protein [Polyangium sp. 15x6]
MTRTCLPLVFAVALVAVAAARTASAEETDADAGARVWASCVERVPDGASRPKITETFPERGTSGWAAPLEITVVHGKGETVMPGGFRVERGSDQYKALEEAGFVLPDPDGGAGPVAITEAGETSSTTKVTIPFVALPKNPGRSAMMLPPVPITLARASGDLVTVCTAPHPILIEDPIANELDPKVRPNPEGRPQREEWVLAKQLAVGALVGAILTAIGAWLFVRWSRRPKPVPYVAPKLPWLAALEELEAIRASNLIAEGKNDQYFDRVSDCVRKYLGARYGFDGLESTTDEMQRTLARVRPPVRGLDTITRFLEEADLVKFARVLPSENDCLAALERGITIVRNTTPPQAGSSETAARKEAAGGPT